MRSVMLSVLFFMCFGLSASNAQTARNSSGADYFTADKSPNSYLTILESAHVHTIPDWLNRGRIGDAMGDVRYTLDRFPNHPVSLQQLSTLAQMTKSNALAISYFEKAVTLYPQYAITRAQYGLYLVATNNIDAGIERFNQAIEIDPKLPAGYAGLAHAYVKKGDLEKAREAAKKARELGFQGKLPEGV